MDSHELKRDREVTLRKIVLHSADALPEEVTAYVVRIKGSSRDWRAKDQILNEYLPLARNLPAVFVDFVLEYLIEEKRSTHLDWSAVGPDRLGIRRVVEFFPAAPVQGPFLHLLREHAHEGLRLIHGLVNAATENWREAELRGRNWSRPRTPIPLRIDLSDREQTFWGDESVYCWFRGTSVAPDAVVSALMALEMWIEQQLSAGRDAEELFRSILADTHSVAIVAVLVGAALAHPGKALDVIEPFVADARFWHMDIVRLSHDASGTPVIPDFLGFGRRVDINRLLSERKQASATPHRHSLVFDLFPLRRNASGCFCRADPEIRRPAPFQFEEETGDLTAERSLQGRVEDFKDYLDKKNYQFSSNGQTISYCYVTPKHVIERDRSEGEARTNILSALALKNWARKASTREA